MDSSQDGSVFGVMNGVKQGGVISLVLFCLCIDDLLKSLAGVLHQKLFCWSFSICS